MKSTNSNYEPLFKPNEITVTRLSNAVNSQAAQSSSPAKDKFANRLNSYGLLKSSEDSPSVRARAPLHREPLNSEMAPKPAMVHSPSVSSTTTITKNAAGPFQVDYKYLGLLFFVTVVVYFVMMQLQPNPTNPLLE